MLKRKAIDSLNKWLSNTNRKPLVIRGARQVGKTQLVRNFCELNNLDLVEVNLEQEKIVELQQETFDVDRCINEILTLKGKKINDRTLIFIDEIQEIDLGYSRLRFFKEQRPEVPIIAAGSLLEAKLRKNKQKIPVGRVNYLFLGPMTFEEFLVALSEDTFVEILENKEKVDEYIPESVHQKFVRLLTDYFFVGGMPEAINQFILSNGNYSVAREVQQQIIQSYEEDIDRYATGKISSVLKEIIHKVPFEIGKKVIYSKFSNEKSTYVKEALEILNSIFVINKVYHSNSSGLPLRKTEDIDTYKIYMLDVGLYNCMMDIQWNDINGLDYNQLVSKGDIAEQFIAQHLYLGDSSKSRPRMHYWLRDKKTAKAEVDFVLNIENKILPLEVKSGKSGTIKSLLHFMYIHRKNTKQAIRLDLKYRERYEEEVNQKIRCNNSINTSNFLLLNIPLYKISSLQSICNIRPQQ